MNTEKPKSNCVSCPWIQYLEGQIVFRLFWVHLCSSVFPVFLLPCALPDRFEEADRAGGSGVERLDPPRHRNMRAHLRSAGDLLREAGSLVADKERARLHQVEIV